MVALLNAVQRVRKEAIIGSSLAMILLVALGDVITGRDISFSAFYLLPVVLAASGTGARIGVRVAIVTSIAWLGAESMTLGHDTNVLVPVWNAGVRFVVFALVVALLDALTTSIVHERALSREDSLSGLPNSRAFYELADLERRAMSRTGSSLTVAYLDIDDFKTVNDTLGHSAGDVVLRSTAATMRAVLRERDHLGRLGGDEFAVILPDTPAEGAAVVLEKLHRALLLEASSRGWPIGYSVGAVTFASAPRSVDEMIARSDQLMYEVKNGGKNRVRLVAA